MEEEDNNKQGEEEDDDDVKEKIDDWVVRFLDQVS